MNLDILLQEKKTPLHYACSSGILDLVKPLLKCCSSRSFINATDDDGDTALHLSTRGGFIEIMKLLRENKADPGWKNLVRSIHCSACTSIDIRSVNVHAFIHNDIICPTYSICMLQ